MRSVCRLEWSLPINIFLVSRLAERQQVWGEFNKDVPYQRALIKPSTTTNTEQCCSKTTNLSSVHVYIRM